MRILHIVESFGHGAVENWLIDYLVSGDWWINFHFSLQHGEKEKKIRWEAHGAHSGSAFNRQSWICRGLKSAIHCFGADVVHSHHDVMTVGITYVLKNGSALAQLWFLPASGFWKSVFEIVGSRSVGMAARHVFISFGNKLVSRTNWFKQQWSFALRFFVVEKRTPSVSRVIRMRNWSVCSLSTVSSKPNLSHQSFSEPEIAERRNWCLWRRSNVFRIMNRNWNKLNHVQICGWSPDILRTMMRYDLFLFPVLRNSQKDWELCCSSALWIRFWVLPYIAPELVEGSNVTLLPLNDQDWFTNSSRLQRKCEGHPRLDVSDELLQGSRWSVFNVGKSVQITMKVGHITDSQVLVSREWANLPKSRGTGNLSEFWTRSFWLAVTRRNVERFVALGVHVVHLPLGRSTLRSWRMGIMDVIAERKLTHLHSHQDWFAGWQWLLLIGVPILKISHIHNSPIAISYYTNSFRKPKRTMLFIVGSWLQCALSSSMLATSDQVISNYGIWKRLIPWRKPVVAYCGIPIMARKDRSNWCFSGPARLSCYLLGDYPWQREAQQKRKNLNLDLNWWIRCWRETKTSHFVVCGKKDEASEAVLMNLVDEDNRTRVHLLGTRSDVRVIMKRAKCWFCQVWQKGWGCRCRSPIWRMSSFCESTCSWRSQCQSWGIRTTPTRFTPVVKRDWIMFGRGIAGSFWSPWISPHEFRGEHETSENPVFELDMKVYVACSFVDEWRARICALGASQFFPKEQICMLVNGWQHPEVL